MRSRTQNMAIGLAVFTVITLGLGKFFDTRAPAGKTASVEAFPQ